MSKTQVGSKLLQKKLLKGHPSVIQAQHRKAGCTQPLLVGFESKQPACCQDILAGLESELPDIMCNMSRPETFRCLYLLVQIAAQIAVSEPWSYRHVDIGDGQLRHTILFASGRYGNYLCSAAFQSCSVAQRLRMRWPQVDTAHNSCFSYTWVKSTGLPLFRWTLASYKLRQCFLFLAGFLFVDAHGWSLIECSN